MFYLILWKEFKERKLIQRHDLVDVEDPIEAINKIKIMNSEKRITSTEYKSFNLSKILEENGLRLEQA